VSQYYALTFMMRLAVAVAGALWAQPSLRFCSASQACGVILGICQWSFWQARQHINGSVKALAYFLNPAGQQKQS